MVNRILDLGHRELLDHAVDILMLGKGDGFLTIEGMTRRPSVDRHTLHDHGDGIDWNLADGYNITSQDVP